MLPSFTQIVDDTTATPCLGCIAIDFLTDTVFSEIQGRITGYEGVTFPAGKIIYVNAMQSITLASGSVMLYLR